MQARTKTVAVSGLDIFVKQVVASTPLFVPGWNARLAPMRTRGDIATSLAVLLSADAWYSIGAPMGNRWLHQVWRVLRKPRIVHWVGSDILMLRDDPKLRAVFREPGITNLAEVNWTVQELASYGIAARLAPLPPRLQARAVAPLPSTFTVTMYQPRTRRNVYGQATCERLIQNLHGEGIRFLIVGGGEVSAPPEADVQHLGWCEDLHETYANTTVLVRFTERDGLSLMVLEALMHGRHVLWSQTFPYVTRVGGYDEIERGIRELLVRFKAGELTPQHDAADFIRDFYDGARCLQNIARSWEAKEGNSVSSDVVIAEKAT